MYTEILTRDEMSKYTPTDLLSPVLKVKSSTSWWSSGFYLLEIKVCEVNQFQHEELNARSGQLNDIANMNFSK